MVARKPVLREEAHRSADQVSTQHEWLNCVRSLFSPG